MFTIEWHNYDWRLCNPSRSDSGWEDGDEAIWFKRSEVSDQKLPAAFIGQFSHWPSHTASMVDLSALPLHRSPLLVMTTFVFWNRTPALDGWCRQLRVRDLHVRDLFGRYLQSLAWHLCWDEISDIPQNTIGEWVINIIMLYQVYPKLKRNI